MRFLCDYQVTSAKGAEQFYQTRNNSVRNENIELAIERDYKAAQVSLPLLNFNCKSHSRSP